MIFRPSESSKRIADFYKRYLLTTFKTNNETYNKQLEDLLNKEGAISSGPYISMYNPYEKGASLKDLVEEGIVSKEILKLSKFYPNRKLYKHQEESIRKSNEGKNLIITTGTGSGKTESFLIPVINELLKEKEAGTLNCGVRTLIIYPMNALVNDQVRRLRELLSDMDTNPKITFGRFTGETRETLKEATRVFLETEGLNEVPENELISREQMRETPPNILITNYAMLEYLLLRPGDNIIFNEENSKKWKSIVFDEAHSYTGAKGIEVGTLVKRVSSMLNRNNLQFFLTSATLGDEKSNDEIINFATSLCDSNFTPNSIIRSSQIIPTPTRDVINIDFKIYKEIAELLRKNEPEAKILEILNKNNINASGNNLAEKLFDMVLHDKFYYKVREVMESQIKTLSSSAKELNIKEEDFTDFIAVASTAIFNNEKIFEAKYHMFIRGIEGVFVTLNPSNKLFIKTQEEYKPDKYKDESYKVFEITFCSNCNAIFIVGSEKDGILKQESKFNDDYSPSVFLLDGEGSIEEDDIDLKNENDKAYIICSKCGQIKRLTSPGLDCGHGKEYENKLIKVKESGDKLNNCPCCHSANSRRSILRPFYLGTEAATAVISTALYEELPSKFETVETEDIEDEFFGNHNVEQKTKTILDKQFLAFSDNRQNAAFFATYLQNTYNDSLAKRCMYELSKEKESRMEEGIYLDDFVKLLKDKFKEHNISFRQSEYTRDDETLKDAWIYTLKEMSNYKAKNSLITNGILMFDLDFELPAIDKLNLKSEETNTLLKILCNSLMRDASIETDVVFTEADIEEFSVAGFQKGYIDKSNETIKAKDIEGWSPQEERTNKRLKILKKIITDDGDARRFLDSLWNQLVSGKYLIEKKIKGRTTYLLNHKHIKVKSIDKLYICNECKSITPFNLKNICENTRCNGHLEEYDYLNKLKDNHYYNLITDLNIEPIKVKEHTAQLSSEQAYEYQKLFRNKEINVLSCSTTFEMGVDVGSLETVFMRNMPPSPANYAQRAGRAGRSLNSAAYAITFCPNNSHDLNFYKNPTDMIKGTVKPPSFNIKNDKIVLRHIFASAFSYFWKYNPDNYKKTIGEFMEIDGFKLFEEYLNSKPEKLKNYLLNVVPKDLHNHFEIETFGWIQEYLFNEEKGICNIVIAKYNEDIKDLEYAKQIKTETNKYGIDAINRTINTIKDQNIIEFLSKNNLIPKYGFPVDTVELKSTTGSFKDLKLSRDLFSAISEYAPESEIVANGYLLKSRYVRKLNNYEWPRYHYLKCDNCLSLNKSLSVNEIKTCKQCGHELNKRPREYIIPKFGFLLENTEEKKQVKLNKPEHTYKGSISYIGDETKVEYKTYRINGQTVQIGNSPKDTLAVLNEAPFYICETCGYGLIKEKTMESSIEHLHKTPTGYHCKNKLLKHLALGHEFVTNVAIIKFLDINITQKEKAWTILYSLIEGLSRFLGIDRNELSGCLDWYREYESSDGNFCFVLFDNTPGGAGYVKQLEKENVIIDMLKTAYKVVKNCDCGGSEADRACYSCLCNYYNQRQHDILKRKYALEFFENFSSSYNVEWNIEEIQKEEIKIQSNELLRITFCEKGIYQGTLTTKEIWENLLDDCDEFESEIIKKLLETGKEIKKPFYNEQARIKITNELISTNLVWRDEKVMLFLNDNYEDYLTALKTGWTCFSTTEGFNIEELLERIGE